jgi:hypothetical protein
VRKLETPYPNKKTAKPIAMTQVVSVRTTVQKQPGRAVGHNHLVALIPACSMLARATTRIILAAVCVPSERTADCRLTVGLRNRLSYGYSAVDDTSPQREVEVSASCRL